MPWHIPSQWQQTVLGVVFFTFFFIKDVSFTLKCFDEKVGITNIAKLWPLSMLLSDVLLDEVGSMHTALPCIPVWWLEGKPFLQLSCNLNYCFFHGTFLLERMTGKLWLFRFEYVFGCHILSESVSCSVMSGSWWLRGLWLARLLCPWNSLGRKTGVDSHSLFQGIFWPGGQTWVSHIAGRFFTIWATREDFKFSPGKWLTGFVAADKIMVSQYFFLWWD